MDEQRYVRAPRIACFGQPCDLLAFVLFAASSLGRPPKSHLLRGADPPANR
jgi:hypothetical protein